MAEILGDSKVTVQDARRALSSLKEPLSEEIGREREERAWKYFSSILVPSWSITTKKLDSFQLSIALLLREETPKENLVYFVSADSLLCDIAAQLSFEVVNPETKEVPGKPISEMAIEDRRWSFIWIQVPPRSEHPSSENWINTLRFPFRRRRIGIHHFHQESDEKKKNLSNRACPVKCITLFHWGKSCLTKRNINPVCPACPVAPADGTGVGLLDRTGVKLEAI